MSALPGKSPGRTDPRTNDVAVYEHAEGRLVLWLFAVPWAAVLLAVGLELLAPAFTERAMFYPLALGLVFLGLPHGALDHLVPARLNRPWGRTVRGMSLYLGVYLALAALMFTFWQAYPPGAFGFFLLATIWHWGQGDQRFLERFAGRAHTPRWGRLVTLVVRGALPIVLPVIAFPETAEGLYRQIPLVLGAPLVPLQLSAPISGLFSRPLSAPWVSVGLVALLSGCAVLYAVSALRAARNQWALLAEGLELLLLALLFSLVPPYFAIGVYFLFWHALRHLGRLLLLRPSERRSVAEGHILRPVWRLTLDLAPLTLAALALLTGLYWVYAPQACTPSSLSRSTWC